MINLVLSNLIYLPEIDPLFWGSDEIKTLLTLMKLDGYFPLV